MKRLAALMLVALLALPCPPVVAQNTVRDHEGILRATSDFASCVVSRSHDEAAEFLLSGKAKLASDAQYRRLVKGACVRSDLASIKFEMDQFRYALAGALVVAEFAQGGPETFGDRAHLVHDPGPTPAEIDRALARESSARRSTRREAWQRAAQTMAMLSQYGECVVRQDPENARRWIVTPPGAADEGARIDALRPALAACLSEGQLTFSTATLRGTLALNYYRLAHAPAVPAPRPAG